MADKDAGFAELQKAAWCVQVLQIACQAAKSVILAPWIAYFPASRKRQCLFRSVFLQAIDLRKP